MNKLLLALLMVLGASICMSGCNRTGTTDQGTTNSTKKDADGGNPPKKVYDDKSDEKKPKEEEVFYKGKSADHWIKQLSDRDEPTQLEAVEALKSIGTKGGDRIPLALLDSVTQGDRLVQSKKLRRIVEAFAGLYPLFDKKHRMAAFSAVLEREIKKDTDDWARQKSVCEMIEVIQTSSAQEARDGAAYGLLLDSFMKRPGCDGDLRAVAASAMATCK